MIRAMKHLAAMVVCVSALAAASPAKADVITYQFNSVGGTVPIGLYGRDVRLTVVGTFSINTFNNQILPSLDVFTDGNSQRANYEVYDVATNTLTVNGDQTVTKLVFANSLYDGAADPLTALITNGFTGSDLTGSVSVLSYVGVPEPASLILLAAGSAAVLALRRQRARSV